ncbi:MAG: transcriptional antiterminator Rof [Campylobacteraceae bacterium]|nr:transcriptional antiterminator Rof [Campylobacteraceae bacterium]
MYNPISNEFYDQLQVAIQRKIPSTIVYIQDEEKLTIKGIVDILVMDDGKEFLILKSKEKIQLNCIFSFNGKKYKEE